MTAEIPSPAAILALLAASLGAEPGGSLPDLPFSVAGGHSLAAARLVAALRSELGVSVSLVSILRRDPTPDQLVGLVQEAARTPVAEQTQAPRPLAERRYERAPLSRQMRPLWAFHRIYPESPAYNVLRVLTVPGRIRPAALRAAAADLAERHDALRSCVLEVRPGQPELVVRPRIVPAVSAEVIHDDVADQEPDWEITVPPAVAAALGAVGDRPFDMTVAPLWRLHVIYVPGFDRTWLLLATHHLISDLRASDILLKDLAAGYERHQSAAPDPPPPAASIVEYLLTEAEQSASETARARSQSDLDWWSRTLGGHPLPRRLPLTVPPASDDEFRADSETIALDAESVDQLARTLHVTSATVLLTATLVTLAAWRGPDDADIAGIPSTQLMRPEDHELVGFLVDTVPVRCPLKPGMSFADACASVRATYLDCLEHASGTLGELMAHLRTSRESARSSLVSLWFNDLTHARRPARFGGVDCAELDLVPGWALFGLGVYVQRRTSVLRLHGVVPRGTFSGDTLRSLLTQVARVVRNATIDSSQRLDRLTAPDPAPDPAPRPRPATTAGTTVTEAVRRHAAEAPDAVAASDGGRAVSYRELAERIADRAAQWDSSSRVALGAARSLDHAVDRLSAVSAGASVVLIDPSWPTARVLAAIELAESTDISGLGPEIVAAARLVPRRPGHGGRAIQFTSGSAGAPRAVAARHSVRDAGLTDLARWVRVTAADRVSFLSGPAHDPSWRDIGLPLLVGGSLRLPPDDVLSDPRQLLAWLRDDGITVASVTPPLLALALAADTEPLPRLRTVISGGAPLSADLARELRAVAPAATIVNGYGCTETPQLVTALVLRPGEAIPGDGDLPVGEPLPGRLVEVRTVAGDPRDIGQLGSIWVAAPHIADGYLGAAPDGDGVTASRFRLADGERWFDTGDLARRDQAGALVLAGRADRQCLVNGHRVVLDDIEAVARMVDVVQMAAGSVVGSGASASIRLVVQPVAGSGLPAADVRDRVWRRLHAELPAAMIPASVTVTDGLTLTTSLKVSAADLMAAPSAVTATVDLSSLPPAAVEIVKLAESVVGHPLGLADNFFEAGFTSLTLLRFGARLGLMLDRDISPVTLFRFPSLERLLFYLAIAETVPAPAPGPATVPGPGPRPAASQNSVRGRRRQIRAAIRSRLDRPEP